MVDSLMVAMALWRHTGNTTCLEQAYLDGIMHIPHSARTLLRELPKPSVR